MSFVVKPMSSVVKAQKSSADATPKKAEKPASPTPERIQNNKLQKAPATSVTANAPEAQPSTSPLPVASETALPSSGTGMMPDPTSMAGPAPGALPSQMPDPMMMPPNMMGPMGQGMPGQMPNDMMPPHMNGMRGNQPQFPMLTESQAVGALASLPPLATPGPSMESLAALSQQQINSPYAPTISIMGADGTVRTDTIANISGIIGRYSTDATLLQGVGMPPVV